MYGYGAIAGDIKLAPNDDSFALALQANNTAGDVANFDALHNHHYTLATSSGGNVGSTGEGVLLDATGFSNALYGGHWSLSVTNNQLALNFTAAVPSRASTPCCWPAC